MLEAEAFPGSFDAKKAYAKVKKWTKKVDVFDQDLLFVPVNEHLHWSLAVVRNSFDCGVYVLKFFDLLFDKPLPARAADDDMTFSNQFRKTLFKREDVKAKREQLLHFFDLEWEKAGGPKASKPKKRARQADDDGAPLSKRPRTP
ncbi:hypothetical protein JL722_4028 [Aureococcus anophagefferens]|nr:hypothetical protein JL722_4028 [Aureococcus anophagefferens]